MPITKPIRILLPIDEIRAAFEISADPPLFMPATQIPAQTIPPIKQIIKRFAFI